jgi:predicted CoA-binding protein
MTTAQAIRGFLVQRTLAIVGVSTTGKKFGNVAYRELKAKGYRLIPVHPSAQVIEGGRCCRSLCSLPEPVGGVLVVVPPAQTERVVEEAASAGIKHVWIQPGAESEAAIRFCKENEMSVIHGECILMFAEPAGFVHRVHRWVWGLLGKLPR